MSLKLTSEQVTDYLLTNSFCNLRTEASNKNTPAVSASDIISTKTLAKTLKLLSGSSDNLDKVLSNLKEMKTIASSIGNSSSTAEREEAYAKLRSLASGMDDILEKTTYDGNELFDGSQLDLVSAGKYNRTVLDDLSTTSKKVGLATETANAEVKISYDDFCKWNNTLVGLKGLDISSATGCDITAADTELENGDYILKISYKGPKSTVSLQDSKGVIYSEAKNVDLSGSGVTTVNLDCGVAVTLDKTQVTGSIIDKYDYENEGAAVLYADINYNRVNTYNLSGSKDATARSVEYSHNEINPVTGLSEPVNGERLYTQKPATDEKGNAFGIGSIGLGALDDNKGELDTGTYKIDVYKTGTKVSAIMYDNDGMIVGGVSNVLLNEDGTTSLDFKNGVAMTVNDANFDGNTTLSATFEYNKTVNAYDDFDFDAYSDSIDDAVTTVTEQQDTLNSAYALANTVSKALNGTLASSLKGTTSQLITNLLGGNGSTSATSLLSGASSGNTGLAWASSLITSNLSASLGLSADSGTSLSSLLSGHVSRLDPTKLPTNVSVTV